jgi:hypothetical protein
MLKYCPFLDTQRPRSRLQPGQCASWKTNQVIGVRAEKGDRPQSILADVHEKFSEVCGISEDGSSSTGLAKNCVTSRLPTLAGRAIVDATRDD